jgi:hypothetical protein
MASSLCTFHTYTDLTAGFITEGLGLFVDSGKETYTGLMKVIYFVICALLTAHAPMPVTAQPGPVGNWLMYFGHQPIQPDWTLWNEFQIRQHNLAGDIHQLIIRAGIGYNLTPDNNNVLLGYGFFHSQNYVGDTDEKISTIEHRVFQQFIHRHSLGVIAIQHRLRTEQRFLPDGVQARLRYMLGLTIPLNHDRIREGAVYASVFNELFVIPGPQAIDRNRIYAAIGYAFTPALRAELGLMRQSTSITSRNQLQLAIFNNIALY